MKTVMNDGEIAAQGCADKLQQFNMKLSEIEKENKRLLKGRALKSYIRLSDGPDVTIIFADNTMPRPVKQKVVTLFFTSFA